MRLLKSKSSSKKSESRYSVLRRRHTTNRRIWRFFQRTLGWLTFAGVYYTLFAVLFDTPFEHLAKNSTKRLESEYQNLAMRYDTLESILENLAQRDSVIFKNIFESDIDNKSVDDRLARINEYEEVIALTTHKIGSLLESRVARLEAHAREYALNYEDMILKVDSIGSAGRRIPSIQPIANSGLTKFTASYGVSMHPFYHSLRKHEGVDYSVPENTRVFATADGYVSHVSLAESTSGKTVTINHMNGYETSYKHLNSINVRSGQRVKRGDIIALSGNSGLSLAPHLHYEITKNGRSVDPLHYFFNELSPSEYQQLIKIAQTRLHSLD